MSCKKLQNMQNELNQLINNDNTTSQNYKDFYKKWNINYSLDTTIKNVAQCSNANVAANSNTLEIPQACVNAAKNLCLQVDNEGKGSPEYDKCWKLYGPSLKNIEQTNKNVITANCKVSSLLNDPIIKKNKELSLLLNMNLAKQLIDCDNSKIYNNALSSNERIVRMSNCVNNNIINQQNIIRACNVSDIIQSNISDVVSNCLINSGDEPMDDYENPNFISSDNNSNKIIKPKNNNSTLDIFDNYNYILICSIVSCCCLSIIIIITVIIMKKNNI
jgi:hypothetical protein